MPEGLPVHQQWRVLGLGQTGTWFNIQTCSDEKFALYIARGGWAKLARFAGMNPEPAPKAIRVEHLETYSRTIFDSRSQPERGGH